MTKTTRYEYRLEGSMDGSDFARNYDAPEAAEAARLRVIARGGTATVTRHRA